MTLADLRELALARVLDVLADSEDTARLKAMGICVGRRIQVVQLGDPLIIRAIGIRIGLSKRLAEHVLIEPLESSSPVNETISLP